MGAATARSAGLRGWCSRHHAVNIAVSIVLSAGAIIFGGYAALLTGLFVMVTDACRADDCNDDVVAWAIRSGWASIVLILAAMVALVVRSLIRRRCAVWWPLLAVPLITVAWFLCGMIASAAVPPP